MLLLFSCEVVEKPWPPPARSLAEIYGLSSNPKERQSEADKGTIGGLWKHRWNPIEAEESRRLQLWRIPQVMTSAERDGNYLS